MPRIRLSSNKTLATPDITHTLRWEYMAMELEFDINLLTEFRQAEKQRIFSSGFKLLNLRGNIEFYPKGNYGAKDGYTSMWIRFDKNCRDTRQIKVKVSHADYTWCSDEDACVYGWNDFIKFDDIQSDSKLYIEIWIEVILETKNELEMKANSMEAIHEFSINNGDITIIVNEVNDEQMYEPPRKKRKINENQGLDDTDASQTKTIKAITGVLKSASPVFNAMLENDMKEKDTKTIHISANSFKDVQDMLYFVTTRR
eukprot:305903_1